MFRTQAGVVGLMGECRAAGPRLSGVRKGTGSGPNHCEPQVLDAVIVVIRASTGNKKRSLGNVLLSQGAAPQVPSAQAGLTAGFGMEPGVSPPLWSPKDLL